MKIPKKRKYVSKYDNQLKIAIAKEYLTSDLGYRSLSKKYNIPPRTIQDFISWYKAKYADSSLEPSQPITITKACDKDLQEANLKITALQMLIESASKELGIDLIKKFGTKQQHK